jgi:hypothetical protein
MAITFVGAGTVASSASLVGTTGQAYTPHASTLTDDLMIAIMHRNDDLGTWDTPPSGWTAIAQDTVGAAGQDRQMQIAYKVATSDSEGSATFTHSDTAAEQWAGCILTYRGIDTTTPWDVTYVEGTHRRNDQNKASTNVDAARAIDTVTDGAFVLIFEAVSHDDITSNADPSGYTVAVRNIGGAEDHRQFQAWHKEVTTAGTETPGAAAYTSNATVADSTIYTFAIRPDTGITLNADSGAFTITGTAATLGIDDAFIMTAGAATEGNTTSRLTGLTGTHGGKLGESVALLPTVDLAADGSREDVWSISATTESGVGSQYEFDVLYEGVQADTITVVPKVTVSAGGVTTLDADSGTFVITGTAANTDLIMPADSGAFVITGTAANTTITLPADIGAFVLTGTAATFLNDYVLEADSGTYVITGTAANTTITLPADSGSFVITGTASNTTITMPADIGAFVITGTAADLLYNQILVADIGAFVITGTAANTTITMPADVGSYVITGTAANTTLTTPADSGAFVITGTDATTLISIQLDADPGAFVLTGTAATFLNDYVLEAGTGAFVITGTAATLEYHQVLDADSGTFVITGTAATTQISIRLDADPGAFIITGTAATLEYNQILNADSGAFVITGTAANTDLVMPADIGTYVVTGTGANTTITMPADIGAFVITGTAATLEETGGDVTLDADSGSFLITGIDAEFDLPAVAPPSFNIVPTFRGGASGPNKFDRFLKKRKRVRRKIKWVKEEEIAEVLTDTTVRVPAMLGPTDKKIVEAEVIINQQKQTVDRIVREVESIQPILAEAMLVRDSAGKVEVEVVTQAMKDEEDITAILELL